MGLDITSYKKLTLLDAVFNQDGEPIDPKTRKPMEVDYFDMYVNPHFVDRADELACGIYAYDDAFGFRAGSYSGYGHWRNQLAKLAGYARVESETFNEYSAGAWEAASGPFWELINFSDCEGTIGPKTSKKLAKDFADYKQSANNHENEWFRELYSKWQNAFEMASHDGAVSFH